MNEVLQQLHEIGLVPVVKINGASKAVPLAQALIKGGLPCAEVTFRTDAAAESIRAMAEACPDLLVGAGTVLTPAQVDEAVAAGARFIVSPGFNPEVVDYCLAHDILVMPGVSDASGVEQCLARGLEVVKFFPAEQAGGLAYIKALAGPYAGVKFMPTGGISPANLTSYTTCSSIFACGGTWMVKEDLIDQDRFDEVERLCREAVDLMLGLELRYLRIPCANEEEAAQICGLSCGDALVACESADQAAPVAVLMTVDIARAVPALRRRGIAFDETSAEHSPNGSLLAISLAKQLGGVTVRLEQKN